MPNEILHGALPTIVNHMFKVYVLLFSILLISCKQSQDGLKKYELDCPKIHSEKSYNHFSNKFSIDFPNTWFDISNPLVDSSIVNVLFSTDTISELDKSKKIINHQMIGIITFKGNSNNLSDEFEYSAKIFERDYKSIKVIDKGFTNILKYDSYFLEYEEDTPEGMSRHITFLIQSNKLKNEYYIIDSSIWGNNDANFELCQHLEILKSFKLH
jgi:hypothetical protein